MYQNIDNMICDADSCEAAICECKRMRKADITAAIIWAAVAVSAFLLILLDAILDINIGDVVVYRKCRKTPCFSYGDIRRSKTKFLLKG